MQCFPLYHNITTAYLCKRGLWVDKMSVRLTQVSKVSHLHPPWWVPLYPQEGFRNLMTEFCGGGQMPEVLSTQNSPPSVTLWVVAVGKKMTVTGILTTPEFGISSNLVIFLIGSKSTGFSGLVLQLAGMELYQTVWNLKGKGTFPVYLYETCFQRTDL